MKNSFLKNIISVSTIVISSLATSNFALADKHNNDWKKGAKEEVDTYDLPKKQDKSYNNVQNYKPNSTKHKFEQPKQNDFSNNSFEQGINQQKPPKNGDYNKFSDKKHSYENHEHKKNYDSGKKNYHNDDWNKSYKKPNNNYYYEHNSGQNYYGNNKHDTYKNHKNYNFGHKNGQNFWGPHGQWSNWNSQWGNPYNYARRWGFDDYHPNRGWRKGNNWYRHPSYWSDWGGWYSFFISTNGTWGYSYNQNYIDPYHSYYGNNCMQLQTSQWEYGRQAVYSFIACLNQWGQYEEIRGTREFEGWAY